MSTGFYKKDSVVFELNDKVSLGNAFYIILSGKVGIKKNVTRNIDNWPTTTMEEVNVLKEGDSFGELALINNQPRSATCYCKEDSHLGILSK